MGKPVLHVIIGSHYCEAARWGLQAAGVDFDEHGYLPGLHLLLAPKKPDHEGKVTPYLFSDKGFFSDSRSILCERAARGHVPEEVYQLCQMHVAVSIRAIMYSKVSRVLAGRLVRQAPIRYVNGSIDRVMRLPLCGCRCSAPLRLTTQCGRLLGCSEPCGHSRAPQLKANSHPCWCETKSIRYRRRFEVEPAELVHY